MKVKALIKQLEAILADKGNIELIAAQDQEGNGYNAVRGVDFVYTDADYEYVCDTLEEFKSEVGGRSKKVALIYL